MQRNVRNQPRSLEKNEIKKTPCQIKKNSNNTVKESKMGGSRCPVELRLEGIEGSSFKYQNS